jgi:hypothetical protein
MTISPTYVFLKYLPQDICNNITSFLEHPDSIARKDRETNLKYHILKRLENNYKFRKLEKKYDQRWSKKDEYIIRKIEELIEELKTIDIKYFSKIWMKFFNHRYAAIRDSYKCKHIHYIN